MLLLIAPNIVKYHCPLPPLEWREYHSLKGVAVDAAEHPNLVERWTGPIIFGTELACNDSSPLAKRFPTKPFIEVETEPVGCRRFHPENVVQLSGGA